jgi:hypothetical protein
MLIAQLARKFGDVPEGVRSRVQDAEPSEQARWAERLLFAESLDAVFAD